MGPSYDISTLKPLTILVALKVVAAHYPNLFAEFSRTGESIVAHKTKMTKANPKKDE